MTELYPIPLDTVLSDGGGLDEGASIRVRSAAGDTEVPAYDLPLESPSPDDAVPQPMIADEYGRIPARWVAAGAHKLVINGDGAAQRQIPFTVGVASELSPELAGSVGSASDVAAARSAAEFAVDISAGAMPLEQVGGLESIARMLSAPVQDDPVVLTMGPGCDYAAEAATSTIPGSVEVMHRATDKDPRIDSSGSAFLNLYGSAGQMVGANQAVRPGDIIGATGMVGFHAFALDVAEDGGAIEVRMRDHSATQRIIAWVDGRPHVSTLTPQAFPSAGHLKYQLLRVEGLPAGLHELGIETITGTFGGLRMDPRDTLLPSRYATAPLLCVIGDSFTVPAQGQWQAAWSYPVRLARRLGMRLHLSGYGGTSFSNASTSFPYEGRLPAEVTPFGPFAAIWVQGSINAEGVAAGVEQSAAESLFDTLQDEYPDTPIMTCSPVLPTHADAAAVTQDQRLRDEISAAASPRGIPMLDTLSEGFIAGTGAVNDLQGDGNADRYAWTDKRHPAEFGADAYSKRFAAFIAEHVQPVGAYFALPTAPPVQTGLGTPQLVRSAMAMFAAKASGTEALWENGYAAIGAHESAKAAFFFDPADYEVPGYTTKLLLRASVVGNAVVPFTTLNAFLGKTVGFTSPTAGQIALTGAAGTSENVPNSTAQIAMNTVAGATLHATSTLFDPPVAGFYFLKAHTPGNMTANSAVIVRLALCVVRVAAA